MLVQFQVIYKTHIGQVVMLIGSAPELGGGNRQNACLMSLIDAESGLWVYQFESESATDFSYRYFVKDDNFNTLIEEWGPDRNFKSENRLNKSILLSDCWRPTSDPDYALLSSAFLNAILKPGPSAKAPKVKVTETKDSVILRFKPTVVRIKPGHKVAVSGSANALGAWNEKKSFTLGNPDHPQWCGEVTVNISEFPVHYKYLIKYENGKTAFWEKATDRLITLPEGEVPDVIEIGDEKFNFPQYPWKGAGVAIPVFALRRSEGFGVGEFTDLKLLVDWAVETGLRLIQILPVNDTVAKHTWMDSYPYAAISVYALHPIYINLLEIGKLDSDINQQIIEAQGKYLNSLPRIDYEAVMALKSRFFKLIYDQTKRDFLNDPEFLAFFDDNKH